MRNKIWKTYTYELYVPYGGGINTFYVGDIAKFKDLLDTDIIVDLNFTKREAIGWGSEEGEINNYKIITIKREEEENDEEYLSRLQREEERKRNLEAKERDLLIQLTAKYGQIGPIHGMGKGEE